MPASERLFDQPGRECPDCQATLKATATRCGCGWTEGAGKTGPDHARIAADRQRMIDGLDRPYSGPRACQARHCSSKIFPAHAVPGGDLCATCQAKESAGIAVLRLGRPGWIKRAGDLVEDRA